MKITDVTLTLFAWDSIPSTIYGHHTARPTGKSDLGLLRIVTDEGIEGHAFLGTSSNPASLDGPALIRSTASPSTAFYGHAPAPRRCARSAPWTLRCGTSPARKPGYRSIG
jgi:hypothetical protein